MGVPVNQPARLLSGIGTVDTTMPLKDYPLPDPFHTCNNASKSIRQCIVSYENDFTTLIGTDYTVTGTSSTFALSNFLGGAAVLTPGAATTASSAYKIGEFLQFNAGARLWYQVRFAISAFATGLSAYVGLQEGATTTEGLWFAVSATGVVSLVSTIGGTPTTLAANLFTMTAGVMADFAFVYDGVDLLVYANSVLTARVPGATLSAALLTPVYQITPTASQTLTVDYCQASVEVAR